jgi:molybdopterin synthase sulfur carrier subunit
MNGMKVKLRLFAQFREVFGGEVVLDVLERTNLIEAIRKLSARSAEGEHVLFDEKGALRDHIVLMRNGKRVDTTEAGSVALEDGDEIAVFPPVAGG